MKKLLIVIAVAFIGCDCPEIRVKGKVTAHEVTSDKYGGAHYHTIISCTDGYIRERGGLKFYSVAVGDSCTLVTNSCNNR